MLAGETMKAMSVLDCGSSTSARLVARAIGTKLRCDSNPDVVSEMSMS